MAAQSAPAELGSFAPDFELPGVCGQVWTRDAAVGPNGLLVMFLCNHCPYVQAVLDRIVRDARELTQFGIGTVAISANDPVAYPEDSFEAMKRLARDSTVPVTEVGVIEADPGVRCRHDDGSGYQPSARGFDHFA